MTTRTRHAFTLVLALALLAPAFIATADHGADDHSENMRHRANRPPSTEEFQSDLAFWGDLVFAGNYDGFRVLDASDPADPVVIADVRCRGPQGDVSVWEHLVFTSVDNQQTKPECSEDTPGGVLGFDGIRIWDASDPSNPVFVKGVPTDCGSHTHTLVPDEENDRVLLYVSSYPLRSFGIAPDGTECKIPHSKISIIEVPLDAPEDAEVIATPSFPMRGLWGGPVEGCHDVSVFMELEIAAAACLGEGQIWDIRDPADPKLLHRIHNPLVNVWHSATFTWDGEIVVFGDEFLGATSPGCHGEEDVIGAVWFYDLDDPTEPLGSYSIPRPQGAERCTMHLFNVIPRVDEHTLVSSTFGGGLTVVDFTDPANPHEVAWYDPQDGEGPADTWSAYWYNGFIWANDINRGIDVYDIPGKLGKKGRGFEYMNPQTQEGLIRGPG